MRRNPDFIKIILAVSYVVTVALVVIELSDLPVMTRLAAFVFSLFTIIIQIVCVSSGLLKMIGMQNEIILGHHNAIQEMLEIMKESAETAIYHPELIKLQVGRKKQGSKIEETTEVKLDSITKVLEAQRISFQLAVKDFWVRAAGVAIVIVGSLIAGLLLQWFLRR